MSFGRRKKSWGGGGRRTTLYWVCLHVPRCYQERCANTTRSLHPRKIGVGSVKRLLSTESKRQKKNTIALPFSHPIYCLSTVSPARLRGYIAGIPSPPLLHGCCEKSKVLPLLLVYNNAYKRRSPFKPGAMSRRLLRRKPDGQGHRIHPTAAIVSGICPETKSTSSSRFVFHHGTTPHLVLYRNIYAYCRSADTTTRWGSFLA